MKLSEGYVLNGIFYRKFSQNKNILMATCGPTGSGKSWADLSIVERWYSEYFHKPYNIDNCEFSLERIMNRLVNGNLEKGEILILEEGGVNLGSLDFQNKIAKSFNYVLQSFRSKNIGLIINLPYFSMLNKQARMLMHLMIQPIEINKVENKVTLKVHHLQFAQESGKMYQHKPKILIDGYYEKIDTLSYSKPSDELVNLYEAKKKAFVDNLASEVLETAKNGSKKTPSPKQQERFDLLMEAYKTHGSYNYQELSELWGISLSNAWVICNALRKKGHNIDNFLRK